MRLRGSQGRRRSSGDPVISKTFSSSRPRRPRAASQVERVGQPLAPTPHEGVRLVTAFHRIKEPRLRDAATHFVEGLADTQDLNKALRLLLD